MLPSGFHEAWVWWGSAASLTEQGGELIHRHPPPARLVIDIVRLVPVSALANRSSIAAVRDCSVAWTASPMVEVGAVCTDPDARGRGYAKRLITQVVREIQGEGDRAFLHVAHGNAARDVYEAMRFSVRRDDLKVVDMPPRRSQGSEL